MVNLFVKLVNMSGSASILILILIILKCILKKRSDILSSFLWIMIFIRLTLHYTIYSVCSLVPFEKIIYQTRRSDNPPYLSSKINIIDRNINKLSYNNDFFKILAFVWIAGLILFLVYFVVSSVKLHRIIRNSNEISDKVYGNNKIKYPVITGIFKPRIILPSYAYDTRMSDHLKIHIQRHDHIKKLCAFFLLALYWFNPLCWCAYILFCKDLEKSCNKELMNSLSEKEITQYREKMNDLPLISSSCLFYFFSIYEYKNLNNIKPVDCCKKNAFINILNTIAMLLIAICFMTNSMNVNKVIKNPGKSNIYTQAEISDAIDVVEEKLNSFGSYSTYYIEYGGDQMQTSDKNSIEMIVLFYFKDPFSKDYNREWGFELNKDDNMDWKVVTFGEG